MDIHAVHELVHLDSIDLVAGLKVCRDIGLGWGSTKRDKVI